MAGGVGGGVGEGGPHAPSLEDEAPLDARAGTPGRRGDLGALLGSPQEVPLTAKTRTKAGSGDARRAGGASRHSVDADRSASRHLKNAVGGRRATWGHKGGTRGLRDLPAPEGAEHEA